MVAFQVFKHPNKEGFICRWLYSRKLWCCIAISVFLFYFSKEEEEAAEDEGYQHLHRQHPDRQDSYRRHLHRQHPDRQD